MIKKNTRKERCKICNRATGSYHRIECEYAWKLPNDTKWQKKSTGQN